MMIEIIINNKKKYFLQSTQIIKNLFVKNVQIDFKLIFKVCFDN